MGVTYSADLRQRVIDDVEAGASARRAAARLGIGFHHRHRLGPALARGRRAHRPAPGKSRRIEARRPRGFPARDHRRGIRTPASPRSARASAQAAASRRASARSGGSTRPAASPPASAGRGCAPPRRSCRCRPAKAGAKIGRPGSRPPDRPVRSGDMHQAIAGPARRFAATLEARRARASPRGVAALPPAPNSPRRDTALHPPDFSSIAFRTGRTLWIDASLPAPPALSAILRLVRVPW